MAFGVEMICILFDILEKTKGGFGGGMWGRVECSGVGCGGLSRVSMEVVN